MLTPIERFQALLDGKKVRQKHWDEHIYWRLNGIAGVVNNDDYCVTATAGLFLDVYLDKWELYEEPKPEIKLTPEMVGKRVRLRFGGMEVLTRYNPRASEDSQYETADTFYSEDGRVMKNCEFDTDIVEVYP